jgi:CheY-like chemotaxis protein
MRLLLVEDDLSIQQFLKRALVEAGYQVDAASTAKAGEAMALEGIHGEHSQHRELCESAAAGCHGPPCCANAYTSDRWEYLPRPEQEPQLRR